MNPNHIGTNFDDFLKEEGIMTDKQIIIDKPKENKCKFISTTGQCLSPINKSAKYCNEIPEEWCYYKQLKRKEQECEELKKLNEHTEIELESYFIFEEDVNKQLDQLKAENETLKQYKASKQASYESMQREWNNAVNENRELKAENEELRQFLSKEPLALQALQSAYASYKKSSEVWADIAKDYKQTLAEIKEIVTNFYETGFLRTDNDCILINNNACVETLDKILQKISEVLND